MPPPHPLQAIGMHSRMQHAQCWHVHTRRGALRWLQGSQTEHHSPSPVLLKSATKQAARGTVARICPRGTVAVQNRPLPPPIVLCPSCKSGTCEPDAFSKCSKAPASTPTAGCTVQAAVLQRGTCANLRFNGAADRIRCDALDIAARRLWHWRGLAWPAMLGNAPWFWQVACTPVCTSATIDIDVKSRY